MMTDYNKLQSASLRRYDMPYVRRDNDGVIIEIHQSKKDDHVQWIEVNDPGLLAFINGIETSEQAKQVLSTTDNEMVRVVEDLIGLLMEKQIFVYTELPEAVQAKLNARSQLRKDLSTLQSPINEDDSIF